MNLNNSLSDVKVHFPSYPKNGSYFDSVTQGLQPKESINAQTAFMENCDYTVRKSLHKRARDTTEYYYNSKEIYSDFFGGNSENYAVIPNSDYGWNILINSIIQNYEKKPIFYASIFDHHSILAPLIYWRNKNKIDLHFLNQEDEFNLIDCLNANVNENTIVMLNHTSPIFGLYRDIGGITSRIKECGTKIAVDYSRSGGQIPINLPNEGVDYAIFDGSMDLLGPQGSGIFYISDDNLDDLQNPLIGSGSVRYVSFDNIGQLRNIERFETGTTNISSMVGLSNSLKFINDIGKTVVEHHRIEIQNYLVKRLSEIEELQIIDPLLDSKMGNPFRSSLICFNVSNLDSHDIALLLDENYSIEVRSGMICAHPGLYSLGYEGVVQISSHIYNSKEEIDRLIQGLEEILTILIK